MTDDTVDMFATPDNCDQITEYDNLEVDEVEVDEQEEHEDVNFHKKWAESEHLFAQYERNFRARRIRELTLAPVKKKRGARRKDSAATSVLI